MIETPDWSQAAGLAKAKGAEIVEIVREEAQGWRLPIARLAEAVTPGTRMIFLTNPQHSDRQSAECRRSG